MAGSEGAPVETEWQFDAIDVRPVERWLSEGRDGMGPTVEPGPASTIVDTYLDTGDWRLFRAGYSLRVRRAGGRTEATLKSLDEGHDGLRNRTEFTEALEVGEASALLRASGPVGTRAKLAAGSKPLDRLFEVRTQRRTYRLTVDGSPAGEIAIDRTTIPVGEQSESTRLRRVEVEVPPSLVERLAPFVESLRSACALQPSALSKFQAGLLARGLQPASARDLGATEVDPEGTVGDAAFAILRRQLGLLLDTEPGTRIGDDPEDLHDMRVATRRLRAALSIFSEALPVRFGRIRDELGWVAQALGAVRDLDVQLDQLETWIRGSTEEDAAALAPLRGLLEEQRRVSRRRMLAVLDSGRYEQLITGFSTALRGRPIRSPPAARGPLSEIAPSLIGDRHRKVRKAAGRVARTPSPSAYHRLRIQAKWLRYTLEFLTPLFPVEAPPVVKRLARLQDLLGRHQDANVAIGRLRSLVAERGGSLAPPTVFAMGIVARRYGEEAEALRARFPKVYRCVSGKRWKALQREVDRRHPSAAAPEAPVAAESALGDAPTPTPELAVVPDPDEGRAGLG
jgi:triphosphatase